MKRIELVVEAGPDKILQFQIPAEEAGKRYHIVLEINPETADEWPGDFIENTAGKWIGEFPDRDEDFRQYYKNRDAE